MGSARIIAIFQFFQIIQDSYGKAWMSWACFCDRVFSIQKKVEWAQYAATCYLQAMQYYKHPRGRLVLSS